MALKPSLALSISLAVMVVGGLTLYGLFSFWVPSEGWTAGNIVSIGFAFFMIFSGGTEIVRRGRLLIPTGEASKRCGNCGAMMSSIARFCRECGKKFTMTET